MNILFDLVASQPENNLKYHGGSEYAKAVFRAVVQKTQSRLYCIYDSGRYLDEDIKSFCLSNNLPLIDISKYEKLDAVIEKYNIDKFYTALPLEKAVQKMLPFSKKVNCIITLHGLRSLELLSDNYELKYSTGFNFKLKYFYKLIFPVKYKARLLLRMRLLIKNYYNPTIITVSDFSRLSLNYFMPEISEENIRVFYSPIIDYFKMTNSDSFLLSNKLMSKHYFLLLSAGIWQKNSYRMLSAFQDLLKRDQAKGYQMVIIGAPGNIKNEFAHNSLIFLDYLDRTDLEVLLKNAHALVYPSLNEGFGYPPLEAFKYGTGVIASAIGSVMEVCGNAALYFNPNSVTEIELRLLQSISNSDFISDSQPRIDRFQIIRQRQIRDLELLADLICN